MGAITVAFLPLLAVLNGAVTMLATEASFVLDTGELRALLRDPATLATTVLVILVVGPLPEEIGWRGYLLDRVSFGGRR